MTTEVDYNAGPGQPPDPWVSKFGYVSYDGSVLVPSTVMGGQTGPGTINTNNLFIQGTPLQTLLNAYLPLTGGTIAGTLNLQGSLNIASATTAGYLLASTGTGGTTWTGTLPGGPYLPLAGGTLTGLIAIPSVSDITINGGTAGQVLSTVAGTGALTWVNLGGAGGLPAPGTTGYLLATASGGAYWTNVLPGGPYAVAVTGGYLALSGGTMTGALQLYANPTTSLGAATKNYVDTTTVPLSGGTMTGPLVLSANPTASLGASTKEYVDNKYQNDNLIINGNMRIDQRNDGSAGTATNVYTTDRWKYGTNVSGTKLTWQQFLWAESSLPAPGFQYSILFTVTATYTPATGDYFLFYQTIEADMINGLNWSTNNGDTQNPITVSFWIYANLPGTYSITIRNSNFTRSYVATFTVTATASWNFVSITIPPDSGVTGSWIMHGNGAGLSLGFSLGAGSTYSTATANTWLSGNYTNYTGQVSLVSNGTSSYVYITGVKLELGSVATPYNYQSLTKQLADCQRYCLSISNANIGLTTSNPSWTSQPTISFPVTMRATPTLSNATFTASTGNAGTVTAAAISNQFLTVGNSSANWSQGAYAATISFSGLLSADF